MFDFILDNIQNKTTGLYASELRTLLFDSTSADLPRMKDLIYGVPADHILTAAEMNLPQSVCRTCFMSNEYCQCETFGKHMGKIILEALALLRLVPARQNMRHLFNFAQLGRGHNIVQHVLRQKAVWRRLYEEAMESEYTETIEGITCNDDVTSRVLLQWAYFWHAVVRSKANVATLVFEGRLSKPFGIDMEWGNREPYSRYSRMLDKEIFVRSHRRMLEVVSGTLWEDGHGRGDCFDLNEFRLLVLLLYCVYEKGDVHDMVSRVLPGYRKFEVFGQWLGSVMCKRVCGYDERVPVYRFVLGTYVEECGLNKVLIEGEASDM
ncbi:hypothetical protein HG535_0F06360 [Zygotorulaspora mrakii]|uniref:Uncharacterized protein n=1 Tax=Zygotorulaspora mrakii TaxID=42260 RepID=A0A7H9B728_ZYGMR|nr:uncharacterized protein HG535_0F06360 [Zygotorulaspora mrakii]QLG74124.1 hypothetical protein HG535_0F06360 [Zygotorulaspora mrakii]